MRSAAGTDTPRLRPGRHGGPRGLRLAAPLWLRATRASPGVLEEGITIRTALRAMLVFVVAAVPVAALALSVRWLLSYYGRWPSPPRAWVPAILIAFGVTGIYGLVLLAWGWRLRRQAVALERQRAQLGERAAFFEDRSRRLTAQVELLSAMREVSRIVSDEVRFERILDESLRIVQDLLDAESITIFLIDERNGSLEVGAFRGPDRVTAFGADIPQTALDYANIEECIEYHTILRAFERERLSLTVPLDADQEPVGVLRITLRLTGPSEEWQDMAETSDAFLPEIARHVALAVKTTHLHSRSVTDGQTGLFNKRYFLQQLAALFDFSRRYEKPLALIIADIDHFKKINDTHGHLAGDMALAGVAQLIRQNVRKYDVPCRYGGEEIAVLMPETDLRQARHLAERIRKAVKGRAFGSRGRQFSLTISLGASVFAPQMEAPDDLVALADQALYRAKQTGRDRVCTSRLSRSRKRKAAAARHPAKPSSGT